MKLTLPIGIMLMTLHASGQDMATTGQPSARDQWVQVHLEGSHPQLPFSFVYGGQASEKLLPDWTKTVETKTLDPVRTQRVLT
jgi:hypothetical protein